MNENVIDIIRNAFSEGKVYSVEFYADGSGVNIEYQHPTANHGLPCRIALFLKMQDAVQILAGFRLKQHELRKCF